MPDSEKKRVTVDEVRRDHEVKVFIAKANENLGILGYTEHGPRHASLVADIAENVLLRLGYPPRTAELAAIAGYLHDIGNGINRLDHGIVAALFSQHVLERVVAMLTRSWMSSVSGSMTRTRLRCTSDLSPRITAAARGLTASPYSSSWLPMAHMTSAYSSGGMPRRLSTCRLRSAAPMP